MLSEIFILRLEAILRESNAAAPGPGPTRFVPIAPPLSPAEDPAGQTRTPAPFQASKNRP
jgi:hypothetical protein